MVVKHTNCAIANDMPKLNICGMRIHAVLVYIENKGSNSADILTNKR